MPDDLIARLRARGIVGIDYASPGSGHEPEWLPDKLCAEAAAALAAKDAEMREHQKALVAERADVAAALAEARDKLDAQDAEIAALRARLAAAEAVVETARQEARIDQPELVAAIGRYDATKEASDAT